MTSSVGMCRGAAQGREIPRSGSRSLYAPLIMLSSREQRVLDFERSWWTLPGPKDRNIYETLGFSSAIYYRVLRDLIDKPDALRYDPLTVRRLRRIRAGAPPASGYRSGVIRSVE